ncbi:DUF397 domain-containing protein [Streptomyces shenzhenensis]|uniref:DUF397 domain-containing protein n=1 Tax=Streptomyces shenzhenensis TaxID=943815 RepID=UPI0038099488
MRRSVITPGSWRKSSYSGSGDGNACVEIAQTPFNTSVRDSKTPTRAVLTFPAPAFAAFVGALKTASLA